MKVKALLITLMASYLDQPRSLASRYRAASWLGVTNTIS
jgi:hypothetical protein